MHSTPSPRLIQVDPQRIQFNPANPRKHQGTEWLRLKESITKIGMVQFPTVRTLPGELFECVDGEGRVLFAQENQLPSIWVICMTIPHDPEALLMLQAANAIRSYGYLDECIGMAHLQQQGMSISTLSEKFNIATGAAGDMAAIGSLPDELISLIRTDMLSSEEHASRWSITLLKDLLRLRQLRPGKQLTDGETGEQGQDVYDYSEVRAAIEKVIQGDIITAAEMQKHVSERRLALFEARVSQDVQDQVQNELQKSRLVLEQQYTQNLEQIQKKTVAAYEQQLQTLKHEKEELENVIKIAQRDVARKPEEVARIQEDLLSETQKTLAEREKFEALQARLQKQADHIIQRRVKAKYKEEQKKLEEEYEKFEALTTLQNQQMVQEHQRTEASLKSLYARKERDLELKTQKTMQQIIANCNQLLAEAQMSILNILSPGIFKGIASLPPVDVMALVAEIRTVRETLEKAEERLVHGDVVFSNADTTDSEEIIIETERSTSNGS